MEINFHLRNLDAVGPAHASKASHRTAQAAQDEVAFENSRALTTALQNTPESREDVVRRATELVGDVNYPPPETIRMISNLLAIQMRTETGGDS
jgi:hypothetical protein